MPIVVVRLGKKIDPASNLVARGITQVLADLRSLVPKVGVIDLEKYVELEVSHDSLGLDRNVEPFKMTVYIEETQRSCHNAVLWRDKFIMSVKELMDKIGVPHDLVPDFQVNLVIGGHHAGAVYDRIFEQQSPGWVDEHLILPAPKPAA